MLQSVEVGPVIVQQFIKRRKVEPIAVTVSMFGLFDIFEDEVFFTGFLAVLAEGLFQVLAMLQVFNGKVFVPGIRCFGGPRSVWGAFNRFAMCPIGEQEIGPFLNVGSRVPVRDRLGCLVGGFHREPCAARVDDDILDKHRWTPKKRFSRASRSNQGQQAGEDSVRAGENSDCFGTVEDR
jgi:hypothetical protein